MIRNTLMTLCLVVAISPAAALAQEAPQPDAPPGPRMDPVPEFIKPAPKPKREKPQIGYKPDKTDFAPPNAQAIVDAFGKHVAADKAMDAETRRRVAETIASAMKDKDAMADLVSDVLRVRHPRFAAALELLADERNDAAQQMLADLAKSDDPYLAANAMYYAARAYSMDERYEQALPLLEQVTTRYLDKTQYSGEAMFFKGVAQAETLDRKAAITTLSDFAKNYPFSSERLVIGALHMIEELSYLEHKSLTDVQDRMDYSRRRLALEESGKPTQEEQHTIVAMLDKLIEEAEQKENSGGGGGGAGGQGGMPGGGGQAQGNQQPNSPATESSAAPGQGRMGDLHRVQRGDKADEWGSARDRQRDEVLNAIKAKYPERYRELVEQYYRSLQEDNR